MKPYDVTSIDELERLPVVQGMTWRPVRKRLGIRAFGVNAYTADEPGQRVVEKHTEGGNRHEELYVVVSGRATFTIGEQDVDVPSGTMVHLPDPDVERGAIAAEGGTTVLALGARPGEAYEPSAWETTFTAYAYAELGDRERGHELLRQAVERDPDRASFRYHLACFDSLAGDRESALAHLRRAVELDPETANWAAEDEDFAALRDDPRFPKP